MSQGSDALRGSPGLIARCRRHKGTAIEWEWLAADGQMPKSPRRRRSGPNPTDRAKRVVERILFCEVRRRPTAIEVAGANRSAQFWWRLAARSVGATVSTVFGVFPHDLGEKGDFALPFPGGAGAQPYGSRFVAYRGVLRSIRWISFTRVAAAMRPRTIRRGCARSTR